MGKSTFRDIYASATAALKYNTIATTHFCDDYDPAKNFCGLIVYHHRTTSDDTSKFKWKHEHGLAKNWKTRFGRVFLVATDKLRCDLSAGSNSTTASSDVDMHARLYERIFGLDLKEERTCCGGFWVFEGKTVYSSASLNKSEHQHADERFSWSSDGSEDLSPPERVLVDCAIELWKAKPGEQVVTIPDEIDAHVRNYDPHPSSKQQTKDTAKSSTTLKFAIRKIASYIFAPKPESPEDNVYHPASIQQSGSTTPYAASDASWLIDAPTPRDASGSVQTPAAVPANSYQASAVPCNSSGLRPAADVAAPSTPDQPSHVERRSPVGQGRPGHQRRHSQPSVISPGAPRAVDHQPSFGDWSRGSATPAPPGRTGPVFASNISLNQRSNGPASYTGSRPSNGSHPPPIIENPHEGGCYQAPAMPDRNGARRSTDNQPAKDFWQHDAFDQCYRPPQLSPRNRSPR